MNFKDTRTCVPWVCEKMTAWWKFYVFTLLYREQVYHEMRTKQIRMDVGVFQKLLELCAVCQAERIRTGKQTGAGRLACTDHRGDVTLHTFDIKPIVKGLMTDMKNAGVFCQVIHYLPAIQTLCLDKQVEEATALMREMEQAGIGPIQKPYGWIIRAAGYAGDLGTAIGLFQELLESEDENLRPSSKTYEVMILALAQNGELRKAQFLYEKAYKQTIFSHWHRATSERSHKLPNVLQISHFHGGMHEFVLECALCELHQAYTWAKENFENIRGGRHANVPGRPLHIIVSKNAVKKVRKVLWNKYNLTSYVLYNSSGVGASPHGCLVLEIRLLEILFWHQRGGNAHLRK